MKETMPVVLGEELYVAIGDGQHEYIVGKTILNPNSTQEKALWERAAKASVIDELVQVCVFLSQEKDEKKAKELSDEILDYLIQTSQEYPDCVKRFKKNMKETIAKKQNIF